MIRICLTRDLVERHRSQGDSDEKAIVTVSRLLNPIFPLLNSHEQWSLLSIQRCCFENDIMSLLNTNQERFMESDSDDCDCLNEFAKYQSREIYGE